VARNSKVGKKSQDRRPRPTPAGGRPRRGRPKVCVFCSEHATWVDYKDVALLKRFINDRGRIRARGATGTCAQHQRDVAIAVKTARELALLPYAVRTMASESRGGRGGDRRGSGPGPMTEVGSGSEAPEATLDSAERVGEGDNAEAGERVGEADDASSVEGADSPAPATA
jgi:small subunit ribosomal protein S18